MDYRARFYSPLLGRFTQPDTIGVSLGSPQSLNRFAYVLNNPILFNDPSGHWCNASGTICADDTDSFGWWSRVDRESEGGSGDNNEPGGIDEDLDGGEGNGDGGGTPGNLDGDLSGDNEEVVYEWYGCLPECEGIQVVSNMVGNMTQEYQHSLAGLVPH